MDKLISVAFYYRFLGLGGVETALLNRIKALNLVGMEANLYFSEFYGEGAKYLAERPDVSWIDFESQATRNRMRNHDAIVVVDNPVVPEILAGMGLGVPFIYETHASLPSALSAYYSVINHEAIKALVVPSKFNKQLVIEHASPRFSPRVVPNCIDIDLFASSGSEDDSQDYIAGDGPIVLWVGRLEDEKNPLDLLKIAGYVESTRQDIKFIVVGDTPDYDDYLDGLKSELAGSFPRNIRCIRKVPYEKMAALYHIAASSGGLLLSTSHFESAPMTFIEAMACDCPVLSSNVGGAPELLKFGRTGLLYPPGDVRSATDLVCQMTSYDFRPERERLVKDAGAMILQDHSLASAGGKYKSIIIELLEDH